MINIIKQEIPIDESLKKKLEFIYDFGNTTSTYQQSRTESHSMLKHTI